MATIQNVIIQPLTEDGTIQDSDQAKTIVAYVELLEKCTGKRLGELEIGDVYCCAWFAVEQCVVSHTSRLLKPYL